MSQPSRNYPRLGLCCQFAEVAIKFRNTTVAACAPLDRDSRLKKLSELCLHNAMSLQQVIRWCAEHQVGAFRVNSQFWPLKTHGVCGYTIDDLPNSAELRRELSVCRELAQQHDVRLSFHPDQFVVLNSPREEVVKSSVAEIEYQAEAAELIGADVVNIHGGGAYGDKQAALAKLRENLARLSSRAKGMLTLENDDKIYTPADLLPVCEAEHIPLCYDVHHHRCLPDGMTVAEATAAALMTWQRALIPREPLFHLSSPLRGWLEPQPQLHHDYIDAADFPAEWRSLELTVDVEAKAKELAIARLQRALSQPAGEVIPTPRKKKPAAAKSAASKKSRE